MIKCSTCLVDHADGTIFCSVCGQVLDQAYTIATRTKALQLPMATPPTHQAHVGKLSGQTIALYVAQSQEPIIAPVQNRVMLGRRKDVPIPDLIDLAPYDAYRMGVSRNHAVLTYKANRLYIHDVGSVNGTWLDGQRLKPYEMYAISSGAALSLGQLTIYIYTAGD